ncbi:MAG TPA: phosphohistidine phosphatase SixA [Opitutaceae bacterium]
MIYLVRHAEAKEAERDEARELTSRGREMSVQLGRFLRLTRIAPTNEVWHSTLVRARQTAEMVAQGLGVAVLKEVSGLAPDENPGAFARKLAHVTNDVMVVGHNPHLTMLGTLLVKGEHATLPAMEFSKCTALALNNLGRGEPGDWCVAWQLDPQMLKAMSEPDVVAAWKRRNLVR